MGQRLGIIITIVLAIGVLVAINSFAYVAEQKEQESEFYPNRSTYSAGATGTKALHDFLNESGYKVMRWREPIERLLNSSGQSIQTFVIIGRPRVEVDEEEAKNLMLWVERGGRLVIIDRRPDDSLLPVSGDWKITTEYIDFPSTIDPGSPEQMTQDVRPISPAQPTQLTRDVESVMPSRFVSTIKFFRSARIRRAKRTPTLPQTKMPMKRRKTRSVWMNRRRMGRRRLRFWARALLRFHRRRWFTWSVRVGRC